MPNTKNALRRYLLIDRTINKNGHASKYLLRTCLEFTLEGDRIELSDSTVEKDLKAMREIYGAPIKYSKTDYGYYYSDPEYKFRERFMEIHQLMEFFEVVDFETAHPGKVVDIKPEVRFQVKHQVRTVYRDLCQKCAADEPEETAEQPDPINFRAKVETISELKQTMKAYRSLKEEIRSIPESANMKYRVMQLIDSKIKKLTA